MNYSHKLLLVVMVCCTWLAYAETDSTTTNVPGIKIVVSSNNGATQTNSQASTEELYRHYAEILEKTNAQLSLWWNPLGVFVGALGVLFALGAIVAGIIIYRQGSDYKKSLSEFENTYRVILDKVIQEKTAQLEAFMTTIDASIKEQQKQLQTAKTEQKEQIESAIQNLERVKKGVTEQIQRPSVRAEFLVPSGSFVPGISGLLPISERSHQCSKCGFGFKMASNPYSEYYSSITGSRRTVTCPKCGNIDSI